LSKLRCILRKAHWHMFILDQVGMGSTQVFQPTIGIEHYDEELFKRTLYVGNLSKSTSEYVIKEIFSVIGNVTDVKMITHEVRHCIKTCRYINYDLGSARFTAILLRYI